MNRDLRSTDLNESLAALLRHGLITMKRDPQDLRFQAVVLTERSQQLIGAIDLDLRGPWAEPLADQAPNPGNRATPCCTGEVRK